MNNSIALDHKCATITIKSFTKPTKQFSQVSLEELLETLKSPFDPHPFKETLLQITQLYYDGLIERHEHTGPKTWKQQLKTLRNLLQGVSDTLAAYYVQGKKVPMQEVSASMRHDKRNIMLYGSNKSCYKRHLYGEENCVSAFAMCLGNSNLQPELIVPVASGGFEPALVAAYILGAKYVLPVRYSPLTRNDNHVLVPFNAPQDYVHKQLEGKHILIIDDVSESGLTAKTVTDWTLNFNPASVRFASVKVSSRTLEGLNFSRESYYVFSPKA